MPAKTGKTGVGKTRDGTFSIVFDAAELPYVIDFIVGCVWLD